MKEERSGRAGLIITLIICAVGTIALMAFFSRPEHHEKTDELFRKLIAFFVSAWNTMPWGIVMLAGGLVVPLFGILVLPPFDRLTRRAPAGSFLYDNVGLHFESSIGLRFLPSLLMSLYLIIAAFMQGADANMSFDPPSYFPFGQEMGAGQWLNLIFMALTLFSLLLVCAEGIISAGPFGMIVHIPVILAANVYIVVLMAGIMFVCVTLLGFIGKLIVSAIALSCFSTVSAVTVKHRTEIRYIEK